MFGVTRAPRTAHRRIGLVASYKKLLYRFAIITIVIEILIKDEGERMAKVSPRGRGKASAATTCISVSNRASQSSLINIQ